MRDLNPRFGMNYALGPRSVFTAQYLNGGAGNVPPAENDLLLMTGDPLLLMTGDHLLLMG